MSDLSRIEEEFVGASLGDERLNRRLVQLALSAALEPAASFPVIAGGDAELEATYRFLANDRVSAAEILAPHVRQTVRRASAADGIIVAHDTTEFNFGKSSRKDLGKVGQGKSHGFYAHLSLVVSASEEREPLGVTALEVHRRLGGKGRRGHKELQNAADNEFSRWYRALETSAELLSELDPVHVMDREADSYAFLATLRSKKCRFVVRMASDKRRVEDGRNVRDVLSDAPVIATREVPLSKRRRSAMPSYRKHFPPRSSRIAQLEIRVGSATIVRPSSASHSPSNELSLNIVHVVEPEPPDGESAVEWRLWTSESVDTPEAALAVVDAYRARWRIEEYFKALKTGCAIEKRQIETHEGLVRTLALFAPIAWRLLLLRTTAHRDDDTKATEALTERLLRCLKLALDKLKKTTLPENPTAKEALFAIARLGGHLKRNGPPGWQTIGKGFDKLCSVELGYTLALEESKRCDQS